MIGCIAWPEVKINGNVKVGGNVGCTTRVEVDADCIAKVKIGIGWIAQGNMIVGEGGTSKDANEESLFTIISR